MLLGKIRRGSSVLCGINEAYSARIIYRNSEIFFNRKVTKPNNTTLRFLTMKHLDFIMVTVMRSTRRWASSYGAKASGEGATTMTQSLGKNRGFAY